MVFSPIQQNDRRLPTSVNSAGCLFRALGMLAEIQANQPLTPEQIEDQYEWLVAQGYMKPNCWVLNHEKVITSAQHYLGVPQSARYVWRYEVDDKDFGSESKANAYIQNVRTKTGIGHFVVVDQNERVLWDPYWPSPAVNYVIGVRGYAL